MHDTISHHKTDVFHLPDVCLGIAGAGDNVGKFAGFEGAGAVGHAEEFGIQGRGGLERIGGAAGVARGGRVYRAATGITKRSAVWVAENPATFVSLRPAARPASRTSISRMSWTLLG